MSASWREAVTDSLSFKGRSSGTTDREPLLWIKFCFQPWLLHSDMFWCYRTFIFIHGMHGTQWIGLSVHPKRFCLRWGLLGIQLRRVMLAFHWNAGWTAAMDQDKNVFEGWWKLPPKWQLKQKCVGDFAVFLSLKYASQSFIPILHRSALVTL